MIVRSHLPWPLRWAALAVMLGFSAAIALWAFELGKELAGLDREEKAELARVRAELTDLQQRYAGAQQLADTADSLLKTERAAQERLAQQLRQLEADKQNLEDELGFYERLVPASGEGLQVRGLHAEVASVGQLRYQMLLVQNGKGVGEFRGRYELVVTGQLEGKAWQVQLPGAQPVQLRRVTRVTGMIDHPADAVIKTVQVRVLDAKGVMRAAQSVRL